MAGQIKEMMTESGETNIDEAKTAENLPEQEILIKSVCETMEPKLVAEDIPLLFSCSMKYSSSSPAYLLINGIKK